MIPGVAVMPFDANGCVLLAFDPSVNAWSALGGAIEPDETPEEAARREVLEEANVSVHLDGLITVLGGPELHTQYANGDRAGHVTAAYRATILEGDPQADGDEVTALKWLAKEDVAEIPLAPVLRGVLQHLDWI
jgi:ADP-ribose pyrophosphatase YjhB (NUDIX family)